MKAGSKTYVLVRFIRPGYRTFSRSLSDKGPCFSAIEGGEVAKTAGKGEPGAAVGWLGRVGVVGGITACGSKGVVGVLS